MIYWFLDRKISLAEIGTHFEGKNVTLMRHSCAK